MKCVAFVIFALVIPGCSASGPTLYPVSGTVTFNGELVSSGYISFTSQEGVAAPVSAPITDGKYSLELTEGMKKVEVEASKFVGPVNQVMGLRPREQYIPEKYNIESTLTAEVSADGDNRFDFALDDESGANNGI